MHKKKIQLPWASDDIFEMEARERKAQLYWVVSKNWHEQTGELTVGDALATLSAVLTDLDPTRKLAVRVEELKSNIVLHGTKTRLIKFNKRTDPNYVANSNKQAKMILL